MQNWEKSTLNPNKTHIGLDMGGNGSCGPPGRKKLAQVLSRNGNLDTDDKQGLGLPRKVSGLLG